jgi:hypothetical protein
MVGCPKEAQGAGLFPYSDHYSEEVKLVFNPIVASFTDA